MDSVIWLIILAILLIIEIITLGITTIWFAGGALVAFLASVLGANVVIQFLLFLVVSVVMLIFTRPVAMKHFNTNRYKTNYEELIGKEGKVIEQIDNLNQSGVVDYNGQEWTARSEDNQIIEKDSQVRIIRITGVKLIVTDKREEV